MKKTVLKITAVAMLLVYALSFVACSVSQDYKEARANLRDNDYTVTVYDKDDVIYPTHKYSYILEFLYDMLEEDVADEIVETYEDIESDLAEIEKSIEKVVFAVNEDYDEIFGAIYFEENKDAKEYYKLIEDILKVAKKEGLAYFRDIRRDDLTYGVNGVVVYFATKEALKASK